MHSQDKYKFSSKGLNKTTLEENGDQLIEKYRGVIDEIINLTSTNRGFRTINLCVATYGQTKKGPPVSNLSALFSLTVFVQQLSTYNLIRFTIPQFFNIHYCIYTVSVVSYYFNSFFSIP